MGYFKHGQTGNLWRGDALGKTIRDLRFDNYQSAWEIGKEKPLTRAREEGLDIIICHSREYPKGHYRAGIQLFIF